MIMGNNGGGCKDERGKEKEKERHMSVIMTLWERFYHTQQ